MAVTRALFQTDRCCGPVVLNLFLSGGHMLTRSGLAGRKSLNYSKFSDSILWFHPYWCHPFTSDWMVRLSESLPPIQTFATLLGNTFSCIATYVILINTHTHTIVSSLQVHVTGIYVYTVHIFILDYLSYIILGSHHWKVICGPLTKKGWEPLV